MKNAKFALFVCLSVLFFSFLASGGMATTTTVQIQDNVTGNLRDTYVYSGSANSNYGTSANLYLGLNRGALSHWRAYLMFNISIIPSGSTIINSTLNLYAYYETYNPLVAAYHVYTWNNLNETNITWNNQPCGTSFTNSTFCNLTQAGGNVSVNTNAQWYSWTISDIVSTEYANQNTTVSFALKRVIESISSVDTYAIFISKENMSVISFRPYINVTYTLQNPTWSSNTTVNTTHWNNTDKIHSVKWSDNALSGHIFSFDNGTGTFVNDTWASLTGTSNWTNITKGVNNTVGVVIRWIDYVNDSDNNWNQTDIFSYTITNTIPTVGNVTISPSPASDTSNLTCGYDYSDANSDGKSNQWYQWYVNNAINLTTSTLGTGNFSVGDNVICSVKVNDGAENSTWANSSTVTIGDTTSPVLHNQTMSATSGQITTAFTIGINVTEANSIAWVYAEITDPSASATNYSMTLSGTKATENYYTKSYTPATVGTYSFRFFARDGSGNIGSFNGTINYSATAIPVVVTPSGGGGGSEPEEAKSKFVIFAFGGKYTSLPLQLIDCLPAGQEKTWRFSIENRGTVNAMPQIIVDDNLTGIVKIVTNNIESIEPGGVTTIQLIARMPDNATLDQTYEGNIYVKSETTEKMAIKLTNSKFCVSGSDGINDAVVWLKNAFWNPLYTWQSSNAEVAPIVIYWGYLSLVGMTIFLYKNRDKKLAGVVIAAIILSVGTLF